MDTPKEYLSREKQEKLSEELNFLTSVRRKEIAESLEAAKSLGDLSENAEYHSAREAQADVEERITTLEEILKNAVIVGGKHKTDTVGIGSTVTIRRDSNTMTYTIVGSEETDVVGGKISNKSPLGEGMIGKSRGDRFTCITPSGECECEILEIK
ncbi:MAG: transcription elongation factor GreA [Patescibacteria group bacterium]